MKRSLNNYCCIFLLLSTSRVDANAGLVIGGFGASNTIEIVTNNEVCVGDVSNPFLPRPPVGLFGWVAQFIDNTLYLCGGADVDVHEECYSLTLGQSLWSSSCSMNYARRYPESMVFNNDMLVMGGYNLNQGWLSSIEKLNPANGCFTEMTSWKMPRSVFHFCAVQMDDTRIMILGGDEYILHETNDMDILDTVTNTWTKGPPMAKERSAHDCIPYVYNGESGALVVGGCSPFIATPCYYHLQDASFFSFATETWIELPPLNVGRMGHKLLMIGDKPTVIGGYLAGELDSIEQFDGTEWILREDTLQYERWAFASPDQSLTSVDC